MLLTEAEIQRSQALVAEAFPRLAHWEFMNVRNDRYSDFCIWARYTVKSKSSSSPSFFVTFDTYKENWRGHLTVGKHCYYWSSADVGDAHLLDTEPCASLEVAITELKGRIASLFAVLLTPDADPGPAPVRGGM